MKKILLVATAGILVFALSGCGASGDSGGQAIDVKGKIHVKPYVDVPSIEGSACSGALFSLTMNGQKVTLKNAEGTLVGATNLMGWQGDPASSLDPSDYGYQDGDFCAFDFVFPGVPGDSSFYTLEFTDDRISPITMTQEEIKTNPVFLLN